MFNRKYIFKGSIFHCYVRLPGCTTFYNLKKSGPESSSPLRKKLAPVTVAKADTGLAASEAFLAAGLSAAKGVKGVGLVASEAFPAAGLSAAKGVKGVGLVASEAFPAAGLSVSEGSKATRAAPLLSA